MNTRRALHITPMSKGSRVESCTHRLLARQISSLKADKYMQAALDTYPNTPIKARWVKGFRVRYRACELLLRIWLVLFSRSSVVADASAISAPIKPAAKCTKPTSYPCAKPAQARRYYARLTPSTSTDTPSPTLKNTALKSHPMPTRHRGIRVDSYWQKLEHMERILAAPLKTVLRRRAMSKQACSVGQYIAQIDRMTDLGFVDGENISISCEEYYLEYQTDHNNRGPPHMLNWNEIIRLARKGNHTPPRRDDRTPAQWRETLTPEVYHITREHGTEHAFSSNMCSLFAPGHYACACCGEMLFDGTTKFESGTGWPSFSEPLSADLVAYHLDESYGMQRIEARCNICDAHLGHTFPDGPEPTGLRYCMNALALEKTEQD